MMVLIFSLEIVDYPASIIFGVASIVLIALGTLDASWLAC